MENILHSYQAIVYPSIRFQRALRTSSGNQEPRVLRLIREGESHVFASHQTVAALSLPPPPESTRKYRSLTSLPEQEGCNGNLVCMPMVTPFSQSGTSQCHPGAHTFSLNSALSLRMAVFMNGFPCPRMDDIDGPHVASTMLFSFQMTGFLPLDRDSAWKSLVVRQAHQIY